MKTACRGFSLDFSRKTLLMGILNVTPDSFSDGGQYCDMDNAVNHALGMAGDGADIIDVGGESSRPGSEAITLEEEIRRTIPVIAEIAKRVPVPVSIDTCKAEVARQALDAGACMINDISGLRFDPAVAKVAAEYAAPIVIMHMKGTPKDMQANPVYDALVPEIMDYLRTSIRTALDSGVSEDLIIIDPGIGFGKTPGHNLEIIRKLGEFSLLGKPVLIGPSRKAFIGKILGDAPPRERLEGTAAAVTAAILNGANIVRIHDVREMNKVRKVADAIKFGLFQEKT